jgi:hypothetical protein
MGETGGGIERILNRRKRRKPEVSELAESSEGAGIRRERHEGVGVAVGG